MVHYRRLLGCVAWGLFVVLEVFSLIVGKGFIGFKVRHLEVEVLVVGY